MLGNQQHRKASHRGGSGVGSGSSASGRMAVRLSRWIRGREGDSDSVHSESQPTVTTTVPRLVHVLADTNEVDQGVALLQWWSRSRPPPLSTPAPAPRGHVETAHFAALLQACGRLGPSAAPQGQAVLRLAREAGADHKPAVEEAALAMYARCGLGDEAEALWRRVLARHAKSVQEIKEDSNNTTTAPAPGGATSSSSTTSHHTTGTANAHQRLSWSIISAATNMMSAYIEVRAEP
jgi:hypothetical protein